MAQRWIRRRGSKQSGFRYVRDNGRPVSADVRARIDALRVPPAWRDVHIAANTSAAVQAWGFDARGRKQYRYHPNAVVKGERRKYYRVRQMAHDLPALRKGLASDSRRRGYSREKVAAGIVRLIAEGFFRVGSERYLRENRTFGLTTLRKSHVTVRHDYVIFNYRGKRGIEHRHVVVGRELRNFVRWMLQTPGSRLFRYLNADGRWSDLDSTAVNEYLEEAAGFPYTAKDLRTWGATLRAATVLAELGPELKAREARRNAGTAVRLVAAELGNTPTICRKSYIHPEVIARYVEDGETIASYSTRRSPATAGHSPEERALIRFLAVHFPERRSRRRK